MESNLGSHILNISPTAFRFEQLPIHNKLFIVREVNSGYVIGYVHYHPDHEGWIWWIKDNIPDRVFTSQTDATEDLIQSFITAKMDKAMGTLGLQGNDSYDKR